MPDNYIPPKKQDLEKAVVPDNAEFYEEMDLLIHLAKNYPDDINVTLYHPASKSRIDEFERNNNIKLTDELKALYMFTDGFSLSAANLDILLLDQIEESLDYEWEWGDTKNYLLLGDMIGDGESIHLDLDSGNIITYDHGEETEYDSITMLLAQIILDFIHGEIDDEKLDEYADGWETTEIFPD